MNRLGIGLLTLALALFAGGTVIAQEESGTYQIAPQVIAPILDAEGAQVGMVALGDDEGQQGILVMVNGFPAGDHGLHLHEAGNCDPAGEKTFEKAGAHFNPGAMTHPQHAGDLGNLVVDASGNALLMGTIATVTYDAGEWGLADADGTALVIHADPDDLVTDPSGNSGARVACAVLAPPAS